MKTIRSVLSSFGQSADRIVNGWVSLDTEIESAGLCITEEGRVFVSCSGQALMVFVPVDECRRNIYLSLDDAEGEKWDAERRHERADGQPYATGTSSPRPSAVMKLCQSA